MLKKRIVGMLVVQGGVVVQSIGFKRYLPVGSPTIAVEYLNRWGIDEIVLLDIDATRKGCRPDFALIPECAKQCQVPLAVGGGITEIADIEQLIRAGADKVVVNSGLVANPSLVREGGRLFGNQCLVASIDARCLGDEQYEAYSHGGMQPLGISPVDLARRAEDLGAGEIFLNSIDRDGGKRGYDLDLIRQVSEAVRIPVIVAGGVGHPKHFLEAMPFKVAAVAAANFFHYTETSVIVTKAFMRAAGCHIRLDTQATYEGFGFDDDGRAEKINDAILEKLRFEYIPEDVI